MSKVKAGPATIAYKRLIGHRLAALRELSKTINDPPLTQNEFADKIGANQQAYSNWELGKRYPDALKMLDVCAKFDCDFNYLYMGRFDCFSGPRAVAISQWLANKS